MFSMAVFYQKIFPVRLLNYFLSTNIPKPCIHCLATLGVAIIFPCHLHMQKGFEPASVVLHDWLNFVRALQSPLPQPWQMLLKYLISIVATIQCSFKCLIHNSSIDQGESGIKFDLRESPKKLFIQKITSYDFYFYISAEKSGKSENETKYIFSWNFFSKWKCYFIRRTSFREIFDWSKSYWPIECCSWALVH